MTGNNEFETALVNLLKSATKGAQHINGTIHSVDETEFTCQVDISTDAYPDLLLNDVPLRVLKNAQASFVEIPKLETSCLVCFRENNVQRPQLIAVHESDKLLLTIGTSTLEVTDGLFKFNGGYNDGMVKVNALITKINRLENTMNTFMNTTFNTHTHVCAAAGSPSAVPVPLNSASFTPITQKSDLENTKITQ